MAWHWARPADDGSITAALEIHWFYAHLARYLERYADAFPPEDKRSQDAVITSDLAFTRGMAYWRMYVARLQTLTADHQRDDDEL